MIVKRMDIMKSTSETICMTMMNDQKQSEESQQPVMQAQQPRQTQDICSPHVLGAAYSELSYVFGPPQKPLAQKLYTRIPMVNGVRRKKYKIQTTLYMNAASPKMPG